jgi:hypothetical protein
MASRRASVTVAGITILLLTGCQIQRAEEASEAQSSMIGMPKEQVLACMGTPASSATAGATDVWTYNSGNGWTDTFGTAHAFGGSYSATAFGSSVSTSRFCKVDIVMTAGRVSRVNYSGPTGGLLSRGEQCAYAVENCLHEAPTPIAAASAPAPAASPIPAATPAPAVVTKSFVVPGY